MTVPTTITGPFSGTIGYDEVARRAQAIELGDIPSDMRTGFHKLLLGEDPSPDDRPEITLGGIVCKLSGASSLDGYDGPVWLWFHGGGYVFGPPETHRRLADAFAIATGQPVVVPRYRLAPEQPWPSAIDDGLAVATALQELGHELRLGGVSSGGHLALNLALVLAKADKTDSRDLRPATRLALMSPNTDRTGLNSTRALRSALDPIVDDDFDARLGRMTFPDALADDPEQSPVLANLSLLPRTHIEIGERELLRDDSTVLYAFAKRAGVDISLHEEPSAFHMWQLWTPWLAEGTASIERMARKLE